MKGTEPAVLASNLAKMPLASRQMTEMPPKGPGAPHEQAKSTLRAAVVVKIPHGWKGQAPEMISKQRKAKPASAPQQAKPRA